jgi:predicted hydrolase (HD superfamily)
VKREPRNPFPEPIPVPNEAEAMRWLNDHWREYPEEWVALDGYCLIAHDSDYRKVSAAAKASGAYLPLITFIEQERENPFVPV